MQSRAAQLFVQRKSVLWPTKVAWLCAAALIAFGLGAWWIEADNFLSCTRRVPADVIVVEGWIGVKGVQAAAREFERGHYRYIVTTSGVTSNRWGDERWSYAESAKEELLRSGVDPSKILVASPRDTAAQRTFESARAVDLTLRSRGIFARNITVFTLGPHARRSRLVFEKVLGGHASIGVISWKPQSDRSGRWWKSSERSEDIVKETIGFLYEFLFNSGRTETV
ncbi:MAG TPA: YdcF family protein [Opitutaceae bacterium]|nr:YdcF family protein [Opitutaceae bacterium]